VSLSRIAEGLEHRFKETTMARKTIFVSDLSGKEIGNDRDAVTITVRYGDARKGVIVVDAHPDDSEVKRLVQAGRQQARRGRRPSRRTEESRNARLIAGAGRREEAQA